MNQQLFDDSTLIRIFALHELHNLKESRTNARGASRLITAAIKLVFSGAFSAGVPQTWPVCG